MDKKFESGAEIKKHIDKSFKIEDLSKLTKNCIEIIKNLTNHELIITDVDDFSNLNLSIYKKEEENFKFNKLYVTLSLLMIAFIDLGIIEL